MKEEWLVAVPGLAMVVASLFGVNDAAREFIQRGGKVRIIVDVPHRSARSYVCRVRPKK
jgi:hypothetical protein